MVHVILTHEVKDAAEWKTHFDSDDTNRSNAGIKVHGVYTATDNPNLVTVVTEFPSMEVVHGFMNNPDLKAAMEKGGVIGAPEVKFLHELK